MQVKNTQISPQVTPRRRVGLLAVTIISVILVMFLGFSFDVKQYYASRYIGDTYYARVPYGEKIRITELQDSSGKTVDQGYNYKLTGYNEYGKKLSLDFSLSAANINNLYRPGTWIKAEANRNLVVYQEAIFETEVPEELRRIIDN